MRQVLRFCEGVYATKFPPRLMPKAILFDLFETLVTESHTRPLGVSSLAPDLGCDRVAFDDLRTRGLRLGVVSNCFAEDVVAWTQCALAAHFDCTAFSFEVGRAKPDPRIYIEAARRLRVDTADTWFIGDGGDEELWGAQHAGIRAFRAVWFLRRWPHFREEPDSTPSLADVQEVLSLVEQSIGPAAAGA